MIQIKLKDINLNNLESDLVNSLDSNDSDDLNDLVLNLNFDKEIINDFNNRIINPKNINQIICVCDFFLIKNVLDFIIKWSTPTSEKYQLDFIPGTNKKKYILPKFMTKETYQFYDKKNSLLNLRSELDLISGNKGFYATSTKFDFISNVKFKNEIQEMSYYGVINWISYYMKKNSYPKIQLESTYCLSYALINNKNECFYFLIKNSIGQLNKKVMITAAYLNNLEIIKFVLKFIYRNSLYGNTIKKFLNQFVCVAAAHNGSLKCLKFLHENGCELTHYVLSEAARNNHLNCMKYAYENGCKFKPDSIRSSESNFSLCKYFGACMMASAHSSFECFDYAVSKNCPLQYSLLMAIRYGQLKMAKYIYEKFYINSHPNYQINQNIKDHFVKVMSQIAITSGCIETLMYCHQKVGSSLNERRSIIWQNIYRGESKHQNIELAATAKESHVLDYLLKNNFKLTENCLNKAILFQSENCVDYILNLPEEDNKICINSRKYNYSNIALETENLNILKKIFNRFGTYNKEWTRYNCRNVECWKYLEDKNVKFKKIDFNDNVICKQSLLSNFLNDTSLIDILKKYKFFWDYSLSSYLAYTGNLKVLEICVSKGCKYNDLALNFACKDCSILNNIIYKSDKLKTLIYLLSLGCNPNSDLCKNCSDIEILKYVLDKNIKIDSAVMFYNIRLKKYDNVKYLFSKGYPLKYELLDAMIKRLGNSCFSYSNISELRSRHLENFNMFQFLLENGCELSHELFHSCLFYKVTMLIPYLVEKNCPIDDDLYISVLRENKNLLTTNYNPIEPLIEILELFKKYYDNFNYDERLLQLSYKINPDESNRMTQYLIKIKCPGYETFEEDGDVTFTEEINFGYALEDY
jgi:hypothetical protein